MEISDLTAQGEFTNDEKTWERYWRDEVLRKVGALVWESTFRSKERVWLTVRA